MASSLRLLETVVLLLAVLSFEFSESARPTFVESESESPANDEALAETGTPVVVDVVAPQVLTFPCHPRDISILQFEASGVGLPTWQVQFTNLCANPLCMISKVIVQCGAFHSPSLVNPHLFRRLDVIAGTCILLDGKRIGNSETVAFQYREIMRQPIKLKSAKVTCW